MKYQYIFAVRTFPSQPSSILEMTNSVVKNVQPFELQHPKLNVRTVLRFLFPPKPELSLAKDSHMALISCFEHQGSLHFLRSKVGSQLGGRPSCSGKTT